MTLAKMFPGMTKGGPWRIRVGETSCNIYGNEVRHFLAVVHQYTAHLGDGAPDKEACRQNAAAIVHAVNNFDPLVKALTALVEAANSAMDSLDGTSDSAPVAVAVIYAEEALKAAKGEG